MKRAGAWQKNWIFRENGWNFGWSNVSDHLTEDYKMGNKLIKTILKTGFVFLTESIAIHLPYAHLFGTPRPRASAWHLWNIQLCYLWTNALFICNARFNLHRCRSLKNAFSANKSFREWIEFSRYEQKEFYAIKGCYFIYSRYESLLKSTIDLEKVRGTQNLLVMYSRNHQQRIVNLCEFIENLNQH